MAIDSETAYPPMTPQTLAEELGVPLSQRLQPDFSKAVPKRLVSKAEAEARGLPWFFDGGSACRYGHVSAKRTSNEGICADCERVKAGQEPIYGKSRVQKFYEKPRRAATSAPVVIQAPTTAQPAEPSKKEQDFLAALDSSRDFDKAAEQTGFSRSQIEARSSVNEVFRRAIDDLCDRRQIPRTLKSAATFTWSEDVERNLTRHFIDSGLLHTAREAVGLSASEYFSHLESSPAFRSMIESARPLALETLKERSLHAASTGNDRLLKILTDGAEAPDEISTWSIERCNDEITKLLLRFEKQGVLVEPTTDVSNADLVS